VSGEEVHHLPVGRIDHAPNFFVHKLLDRLRGFAGAGNERPLPVGRQDRAQANRIAYTPATRHLPGDDGELLDVRLASARDRSVHDLLRDAPATATVSLATSASDGAGAPAAARRLWLARSRGRPDRQQ
jgi:hypothetical protein